MRRSWARQSGSGSFAMFPLPISIPSTPYSATSTSKIKTGPHPTRLRLRWDRFSPDPCKGDLRLKGRRPEGQVMETDRMVMDPMVMDLTAMGRTEPREDRPWDVVDLPDWIRLEHAAPLNLIACRLRWEMQGPMGTILPARRISPAETRLTTTWRNLDTLHFTAIWSRKPHLVSSRGQDCK